MCIPRSRYSCSPEPVLFTTLVDNPPSPRIEHTAGGRLPVAEAWQSQFAFVFRKKSTVEPLKFTPWVPIPVGEDWRTSPR